MSAEAELTGFVAKFAPEMQTMIRGCRAAMRARLPEAIELVYDNYNFLVIGYSPTTRTSDAIFSLAAYRGGVNLCFLQRGPEIPDPSGVLRGDGKVVRNLALTDPADLGRADVGALVEAQLALARVPMESASGHQLVIRSVSAKQRPRR
jgi:hypothetical protein